MESVNTEQRFSIFDPPEAFSKIGNWEIWKIGAEHLECSLPKFWNDFDLKYVLREKRPLDFRTAPI